MSVPFVDVVANAACDSRAYACKCISCRSRVSDAVFATHEMQGIKAAMLMWANWPTNPLPPAEKLRLVGVPDTVIEWVLS